MKNLILFFLSLSSVCLLAQDEIDYFYEDYNKDGYTDTLMSYFEGGSGFGGRYVIMVNGKTNETYELTNDGCYCNIFRTILIPPILQKEENTAFLEIMKKQILPKERKEPESSLEWILKSNKITTKDNKYFNIIYDPQNPWVGGKVSIPANYYISLSGKSFDNVYFEPYEVPDWYSPKTANGFLVYYAHNHFPRNMQDSLVEVGSIGDINVFKTAHGIFVQNDNLYKCVFVTDYNITGGPEKLRWESISEVLIYENCLIVKQSLFPAVACNIFIINILSGKTARLKYNVYKYHDEESNNENLFIEDGKLVLIEGRKQQMFRMNDIIKELNSFDENYK